MRFHDVTLGRVDVETERVLAATAALRDETLAAPSPPMRWRGSGAIRRHPG